MNVEILSEHHLEFVSLKVNAEARMSLHMSKCHIVGNLMHWLNYNNTCAHVHMFGASKAFLSMLRRCRHPVVAF